LADAVNAPLWGDVDNDGLVDVYLCRRGPNQLWRQSSPGVWADITESAGVSNGDHDTVDGALVDADHDGDLDVFVVNADAPDDLLSNNLDGTFRSIGADRGIDGAERASRQVLVADLDADRDADIVVLHEAPPHDVFLNDRMWAYSRAPGVEAFAGADLVAVVHADLDADGVTDLIALDRQGNLRHWAWSDGLAGGDVVVASAIPPSEAERATIAALDATGDGSVDVLVATPAGWSLYAPSAEWAVVQRDDTPSVVPVWDDALVGHRLIGHQRADDGTVRLLAHDPVRTPPASFAALALSGAHDPGQSMRTNASAIGARVAARVGTQWTVLDTFRNTSGPGQSLQPLAIGLGGAPAIDFIEIDWPDGVFQSEIDVPAGELTRVAETQRQLSSCPVLFAWNGDRYEFVTDLLGVGGIGYAIGPDQYAEARPWENVLLPDGVAHRTADGHYSLLLTEPMEEACYLDSARLVAYDLPPGWQMVLDERMGISDPQPT
ncbi:MAG: CRTAC1 family protein, partial [Chloroflexi bacterium]|nr:CRTAC1 family protein [Chloroflexota bacterium]